MIGTFVRTPPKAAYRIIAFLGIRRLRWLAVGALIGALVTPVTGRELRRRLVEEIMKRRAGSEPTVADPVDQAGAVSGSISVRATRSAVPRAWAVVDAMPKARIARARAAVSIHIGCIDTANCGPTAVAVAIPVMLPARATPKLTPT